MRYWCRPSDGRSLYTTSQTSPALSSHAVMRLKKPKSLGLAVGLKRTRSPRLNVCGIIRPHSVDVRGSGVAGGEGAFLWAEGENRSLSLSARLVQSDGGSAPPSQGTIADSGSLCSRARAVPRADHPSPKALSRVRRDRKTDHPGLSHLVPDTIRGCRISRPVDHSRLGIVLPQEPSPTSSGRNSDDGDTLTEAPRS
jgi:hypothetical protein